jgi:RNA recognition motif-containing protein
MTARLYIDNLPPSIREEDLDQMFSMYGRVQYLYLQGEWEASPTSRFAFVDFVTEREATSALEGTRDLVLGGRRINVMLSRTELKLAS